jgi:hypothetical protein
MSELAKSAYVLRSIMAYSRALAPVLALVLELVLARELELVPI